MVSFLLLGGGAEEECTYSDVSEVPIPSSLEARVVSGLVLKTSPRKVLEFGDRDESRYLSVLQFGDELWIGAKRGHWPHASGGPEPVMTLLYRGCDLDLRDRSGGGGTCVRNGTMVATGPVAANFALAKDAEEWWGLGGELNHVNATTAVYSAGITRDGGISAYHPGCIELRQKYAPRCEFDGRFSVACTCDTTDIPGVAPARKKRKTVLYARANTNPHGGGRHVSVAKLQRRNGNGTLQWKPFRLVQFQPPAHPFYEQKTSDPFAFARVFADPGKAPRVGDIYTAAVNAYAGYFLGLFAATIQEPKAKPRGAILFAASHDGRRFSTPIPIVAAIPAGHGEVNDHAVDGLVLDHGQLYFYVHHGVPGTFLKHNRRCPFFKSHHDDLFSRLPNSQIVRYAFNMSRLHRYLADLDSSSTTNGGGLVSTTNGGGSKKTVNMAAATTTIDLRAHRSRRRRRRRLNAALPSSLLRSLF